MIYIILSGYKNKIIKIFLYDIFVISSVKIPNQKI